MKHKILFFTLLGVLLFSAVLKGENRFPRPEFSKKYQVPKTSVPSPSWTSEPYIALGALVLVLILSAYSLYHRRSRRWILLLVVLSLLYFGFFHRGCVCSIGSIQNAAQSLFDPVVGLPLPILGVFLLPLLSGLFMGRIFCGAACPLGAIQELVILRPLRVPAMVNLLLKQIPYAYLGLALLFSLCGMGYIICQYDPFVGFFRFSATLGLLMFGGALLLLGTVVARPYCRYLCPYSVLLKMATTLAVRKVEIIPEGCNNCHLCRNACPVGAIVPPRPVQYVESKDRAIQRLSWLVALSPAWLALGLFAGSLLIRPLARFQPDIALLFHYKKKGTGDEKVGAFLINQGTLKELNQRARHAQRRLKIACTLFGGYMALVLMSSVVALSRRRTNLIYTVKATECVACARCYSWCPLKVPGQNSSKAHPSR